VSTASERRAVVTPRIASNLVESAPTRGRRTAQPHRPTSFARTISPGVALLGLRVHRRLGRLTSCAPCALGRVSVTLAAAATVAAMAGCGTHTTPVVPQSRATDRLWLSNAVDFVSQLQSDLSMSDTGGANLATARRVIRDTSDIVTMLVAYNVFGACTGEVENFGGPPPRAAKPVLAVITKVCQRLEHATSLFTDAMTNEDPVALLAATRAANGAAPLLAEARSGLARLRSL
jgi:hypothetical protein